MDRLDEKQDICTTENIQKLLRAFNYVANDYSPRLEEVNKAWDLTCQGKPYTAPVWMKKIEPAIQGK